MLLGLGCSSSPRVTDRPAVEIESTTDSIDELLVAAERLSGPQATALHLLALEQMLDENQFARAANEIERLNPSVSMPAELQLRYILVNAEIALGQAHPEIALRWLTGSLANSPENHPQLAPDYYTLLGDSLKESGQVIDGINAYIEASNFDPSSQSLQLQDKIWLAFSQLEDEDLSAFAANANSYQSRGWIELARTVRVDQFSIRRQLDALQQWRRIWTQHDAANNLPGPLLELQQIWDQRPMHIALILPLQRPAGNAIQEGFLSAYYQALEVSREVPRLSVYDSSDISEIYSIYDEAVSSGADLIIGPLDKALVIQLQGLANLPVPTLALNYADSNSPSAVSEPGNLFQFGLAPEDEIRQAVSLAWESGYRNAAVITRQTEAYLRLQNVFTEQWTAIGGTVVSQTTFNGDDSDYATVIKRLMAIDSSEARKDRLLALLPRSNIEFTPRRRNDIDFIFLIATPRQGRQIKPTLAFYFAENIPVFAMPSIYDGLVNQNANRDLNGIVFSDAPWVLQSATPLKSAVTSSLRPAQGQQQRFRALGIDSFQLYTRLQQMAEQGVDSLQGATGTLTMGPNQRIRRELENAQFIDGLARDFEPRLSNAND